MRAVFSSLPHSLNSLTSVDDREVKIPPKPEKMELPFLSSTPAKRPFEAQDSIPTPYAHSANGAFKRRPKPPPPPIVLSPGHAAFRLLCPISKIGGIIGKSGSVVNLIRNETGAKICVEDPVPACDERVILVVGPTAKKTGAKAHLTDGDGTDGGEGGRDASPAQEALVRVFGRVLEVDAEMEVSAGGGAVSCRLLVPMGQVGPVMGKGGKVIEKIRKESGAKIRVLPREQLPACALPSDEVIQGTTVRVEFGDSTTAADPSDAHMISQSFPHTYGQPLAHFLRAIAKVSEAQIVANLTERQIASVATNCNLDLNKVRGAVNNTN